MTAVARLVMKDIVRHFGLTRALAGVDLTLRPGEVHALIGENGAGKSTLTKILSGAIRPDRGSMTLDGSSYAPRGPHEARRAGVAMIYQELTLAPHLSVEANVMLGLEKTRWGFLRTGMHRRKVREALALLEHPEIDPDRGVGDLSPAAQQLVEIARALLVDVRVLALDEPTSSLTRADAQRLFALVRRLRDRGVSVIYISHFLDEVEQIADRFTVLRDGQSVGTDEVRAVPRARIIEMMVGRPLAEQYPRVPHTPGEVILETTDLEGVRLPRGVSFSLRRGEILGIAGLVGSGRTELLRVLFGLDPIMRGTVCLRGVGDVRITPQRRVAQGMSLLSEDRKGEGLTLDQSLADNLTYTRLHPYARAGILNLRQRRAAVAEWVRRLGVRCRSPEQTVGELSGGNQQKVALGRLLHQEADVLLLDEPTRGVDIGSKAEIYRLMGEQAAAGKAILFVSSDLQELLGVCDRLAVMARGRLSEIRPTEAWTAAEIMAQATEM